MTDVSKTIEPKSDQINFDDLIAGTKDITITKISAGDAPQPINVGYDGDNGKVFRPCKSMRRVMVSAWGSDGHQYVGKTMRLYGDPNVKFGGIKVGGIRISHMSHIERDLTIALTASRAVRKPYTVKRLVIQEIAPEPNIEAQVEAYNEAQEAATAGTDSFKEWFASDAGKSARQAAGGQFSQSQIADLKAACAEADAPNEKDNF